MGDAKHIDYPDQEKGHDCIDKSTENGACLTGHVGQYQKRSCAYRWQAHEVSKAERRDIYHRYAESIEQGHRTQGFIPTSRYMSAAGNPQPAYYAFELDIPKPGDWDLDGPRQSFRRRGVTKVEKGKNFTKDHWPYWQNAHHMIPKSLFNGLVNQTDEALPGCAALIRGSLLSAKYNINHKINMIILPMDKEVAKILGLPRHLTLKEPGRTPDCTDHKVYTSKVEKRLKAIIDGYKKIVSEAKAEDHDNPKPTLDKKKLEKLSRDCYQTILQFGMLNAGEPLDAIPAIQLFRS